MFAVLARSTVCLVLSFVLVVALLALMAGLPEKIRAARAEAANLERVSADLEGRQTAFKDEATSRVTSIDREVDLLRRAGSEELRKAETAITAKRTVALSSLLDEKGIAHAALAGNSDKIVASYRAEYIDLPLADRALSLIALRRQNLQKVADRKQQMATLNGRIAAYNRRVAEHNERTARRNDLALQSDSEFRNPLCRRVALPVACKTVREIRSLDARIAQEKVVLDRDKRILAVAQAGLKALKLGHVDKGQPQLD